MTEKLVLHEYAASGNCYKVRLTAACVGTHVERREYDIMKGETRTPHFLANVNSNGRIPVLQIGGRFIPESNAACYFIADGTNLIPTDPFDHADMLRWMFWEQYNHEPNIATLKFWMRSLGPDELTDQQRMQMPAKRKAGNEALKLMDEHLTGREWLVAGQMSLADIVLFAYTHLAHEAEFKMGQYPRVQQWIDRIKGQPKYLAMNA